jgi:hypothetical protein
MSALTPFDQLVARSVQLGVQADRLRAVAARVVATAASTRWRSAAGAAFRDRAHESALGLRAAARRLDDAADAMRRGAH